MKKRLITLLCFIMLFSLSNLSFAQDDEMPSLFYGSFGVGTGFGQWDNKDKSIETFSSLMEDTDVTFPRTSYFFSGGANIADYLLVGFEINFMRQEGTIKNSSDEELTLGLQITNFLLVGHLVPLGGWGPYVKGGFGIGVTSIDSRSADEESSTHFRETGTAFLIGGGFMLPPTDGIRLAMGLDFAYQYYSETEGTLESSYYWAFYISAFFF